MIRVTIWNEFVQERGEDERGEEIRKLHPNGIHETLCGILGKDSELQMRTATLDMPECGLSEAVLDDTDVLLWWAHVAHEKLPDEIARRVQQHVLKGMGFIALHSAHLCKPLTALLGTSCTLQWRDGDACHMWNACPTHPIMEGVPQRITLDEEEMYGEFFDIPKPDDVLMISWFSGGEVFRSACTWTRGYGRMFYLQPGHETNTAYFNPDIQRILLNAVRWATPTIRREALDCPHAEVSVEAARLADRAKGERA